jgi:TIGR03009 family protein
LQAPASRGARPESNELVLEPISAELEQLLTEWERASSEITAIQGEHKRIVYTPQFKVEKHAAGRFYVETPDKGRIDVTGLPPKENQRPNKPDWTVVADHDERWICTGREVIQISDSEKSFQVHPLPESLQGKNIVNGPLPFLFGLKVNEMRRRYRMKLLNSQPGQVWIEAIPLLEMDSVNFQRATIILDRKRFLPTAVKLIHPGENAGAGESEENQETVYLFTKLNVNHSGLKAWALKNFGGDPFRPALKGYTMIQPPVVGSETNPQATGTARVGVAPAGRRNAVRPVGGVSP